MNKSSLTLQTLRSEMSQKAYLSDFHQGYHGEEAILLHCRLAAISNW
jgi:hypothetical protein